LIESSEYARELYKRRSEVERQFRRFNGYRRIFSRFGKLNAMFQAFICLALIADGLRQGEQALVGTMLNRLLVVLKDSTKRRSILIQRKPLPQRLRPNELIADRSPPTRSVGREKQMLGLQRRGAYRVPITPLAEAMNLIANMKIGVRLGAAFAFLIAALLVVTLVSWL
jgi:hypothetical protein